MQKEKKMVKIYTICDFVCPKCKRQRRQDYLIKGEFLKCPGCGEKFSKNLPGLDIWQRDVYQWSCPSCGWPQFQNFLINKRFLECQKCFHWFYQDENGKWQLLEEPEAEIKLRKKRAGR
jgi:hypothetical protein